MTSNPAFTERNIQKANAYLLYSRQEQKSLVTYHTLQSLYVCVWLVNTLTSTAPIGSPIICVWFPADICEQWERNLSFSSADVRGEGTRDARLRMSAGEAILLLTFWTLRGAPYSSLNSVASILFGGCGSPDVIIIRDSAVATPSRWELLSACACALCSLSVRRLPLLGWCSLFSGALQCSRLLLQRCEVLFPLPCVQCFLNDCGSAELLLCGRFVGKPLHIFGLNKKLQKLFPVISFFLHSF